MNRSHSTIKTLAVAVALTLPATLSIAVPMSDVVTTREDQSIHQKFGRDSVYAIQTHQPDQGYASNGSGGVGDLFAGVGAFGAAAWDKVTGLFESGSPAATATEPEPRFYGRAGGYAGTDKLALLDRAGPATETSEPVTTREAISADDLRYPAASEEQLYGPAVVAQRAPSPEAGTVRTDELEAAPEPGRSSEQDLVTDEAIEAGTPEQPDELNPAE